MSIHSYRGGWQLFDTCYLFYYTFRSFSCAFFFSSRRRHTRFDCDWSSDVCSSDLVASIGTLAVLVKFRADFGIVTEPTELRLCLAHKGFVWLEVETKGVAAHGSRAEIGRASCRERV